MKVTGLRSNSTRAFVNLRHTDPVYVCDLKAELKKRSLPVSGPKPQLIERLKPFTEKQLAANQPPMLPTQHATSAAISIITIPSSSSSDDSLPSAYDFNWSMRKLFGNGVPSSCSQAETSAVYVDITANLTGPVFEIFPDPTQVLTSLHGGQKHHIAMYNLIEITKERIFNVYTIHEKPRVSPVSIQPTLYAHRYITGYGQERGGIVTKIHNKHRTPLKIIYLENIPWFTPLYYHTLKITSGNKEIIPLIKKYIPGKARVRPYYLEVAFEAPARSVTTLSVDFTYMFLKWQEYPPDANHGFYLGSAIITALLPTARNYTAIPQTQSLIKNSFNISRDGYLVQLRTEALIVALPTPDFSMPYNVICLACTVVALAFGPLHNIASKRLRLTVIRHRTILQRLKRVLNVVTGKHAANKSDDEDEDKKENKEEKGKEETKDKAQTETDEGSCKVRDTKKDK
ncbi:GPI transamidase component PIG-T [Diaphorina citri]|uniref:GPI transamidase component PIG-T n=1 Tax=Diaphorina citri TaxID=121845 RepID=A0A1S4EJR6_DIACI|nr:GPI transamidase component PIG-T [Diaphorina citri]